MNFLTVGIGDCKVSNARDTVLATYALGSCIALVIYDPVGLVGGLLHFMLPDSALSSGKADQNPYMFADTGIPRLFQAACKLGAVKRRLIIGAIGGARAIDDNGMFNIGQRNYSALRKSLWQAGVCMIHREDLGGRAVRSVRLDVTTGRLWISSIGSERNHGEMLTSTWNCPHFATEMRPVRTCRGT